MPDREILLQSRAFRVVRATWDTPEGAVRSREFIEHPGAVAILPVLDDGRVVLIGNLRKAVGERLLEIPAGTLEPDESPFESAARELAEETGYRAAQIEPITTFFTSPGILDERMHLFLATGLTPGPMALEVGEDIVPRLVTWEEVRELLANGAIRDAKTLTALLWYEVYCRRA